jgi:glycosyltransferase involved in cell wall biosynthesis/2-polyprenyl-3-methyl-5-hydroxy-6-metoxy-1,4-benzoquinol methylase
MLNACTIIACNYLPYARVLAESFRAHHPHGQFTILLIDDEAHAFTPPAEDRILWRRLSEIGLEPGEILRLAGIYDVTELATAVKPVLLRKMLDEGRDEVVYLDPDIRIYDSLDEVARLAAEHGIVLTPHTMQPYPNDERQIDPFFILAAGVYNLGFIGVGAKSRPFLDWWWDQTRREALIAPTRMMFTDQRWVDFVPSFFDHHILKDPGYNVAYWNLHARDVRYEDGRYTVDGAPLRFFHFSGFDPGKPWLLSKHQGDRPRVLLSERPVLARICEEYRERLDVYGSNANGRQPYGWNRLPSGMPMTARMRRLYWEAIKDAEEGKGSEPPGPFDAGGADAFVAWLNTPAKGGPRGVSRFLYSIYEERPDLRMHFPDVGGRDAGAFADWVWSDGVRQEEIPDDLLPNRDPATPPATPVSVEEGVNIAGYFRAELGIGEAARQLAAAVEAAGLPHATTTYDATLNRQSHPFSDRPSGAAYDLNVVCVNADSTPKFAGDVGPEFFRGRHTAGYWFWEVEDFPKSMHAAFDIVDEVWTATDFIARAVRGAGLKPVYTVPLPVSVPRFSPSLDRAHFGLSDAFTFVFIFDFLSIFERKNPLGLISAFTTAFAPGEGPVLVIKSINGNLRLAQLERLRAAIGDRTDVRIVDGYYTAEEKNALVGVADCYVSLHRSEGLGLTMAEAMALGKPVIATGYSGNLHFMTPENSFLVGYSRARVPPGCAPYPTTTEWAEPDEKEAAALMRDVYERRDAAREKGAIARQDILERHNLQTSAQAVRARVEAIRAERRKRVAVSEAAPPAPPPPPAMGVEHLEALLGPLNELATLRLSADGRPLRGLRLLAQRALFRILRPLWFQQHQFYAQVVGAFRLTSAAIRAEQLAREAVDTRLRELTRRVLSSRREVDRLGRTFEQFERQRRRGSGTAVGDIASTLEAKTRELSIGISNLQTAESTFQQNAAAHLEALTVAVQKSEREVADLWARLFASPYMADAARYVDKDSHGRDRLGYRARRDAARRGVYVGFEDVFRGPETLVRARQQPYLPLLAGRAHVVDLGCGRGEMLDLLRDAGVPSTGVDPDADMAAICRAKGHTVVHQDALTFMRGQAPGSLPAVFSAQMIEHLPFTALKELLDLTYTRLQPGGVAIFETVNPHALEAFKTFYTDLTHEHPIFPEVALAWCELVGFDEAYVFFPRGTGDLSRDRQSQGEYAVVATVR